MHNLIKYCLKLKFSLFFLFYFLSFWFCCHVLSVLCAPFVVTTLYIEGFAFYVFIYINFVFFFVIVFNTRQCISLCALHVVFVLFIYERRAIVYSKYEQKLTCNAWQCFDMCIDFSLPPDGNVRCFEFINIISFHSISSFLHAVDISKRLLLLLSLSVLYLLLNW